MTTEKKIGTIVKIFYKNRPIKDKFGNIDYFTIKGEIQVELGNYKDILTRLQFEKID